MKKTLLALMTAGTIGCGSYGREIELNNPILDVTAGDYIIKDVSYFDIDIDGNSAPCRKWVGVTVKDRTIIFGKRNHSLFV